MKRIAYLLALAACGAPAEIETICTAATQCGVLSADELDICVEELDAATPDSASRAASECAACMETTACGDIADGGCRGKCEPLADTIHSQPGTISGACSSTSLDNFAQRARQGLVIAARCTLPDEAPDELIVEPGDHRAVGDRFGCGKLRLRFAGACEVPASGSLEIISRDGRRWVKGSCACGPDLRVNLEVPYVIAL